MTRPRIALIVAVSENHVIGRDGGMPWHLPEDMKHFKRMTMGKPMIMGRRTFESIGKALPGRTTIVVTRADLDVPGVVVRRSIADAFDEAVRLATETGTDEVMIVGGGKIYADTIARADRLYLTRIHDTIEGDTWLPAIVADNWNLVKIETVEVDGSGPNLTFETLDRVGGRP